MTTKVKIGEEDILDEDAHDLALILRVDGYSIQEGVSQESYYGNEIRPQKRLSKRVLKNVASILDEKVSRDLEQKWENLFITEEGEFTEEETNCIDFFLDLVNVLRETSGYQGEECATPFHVYLDGNYFGSVCLFLGEYTMFQGITKSFAHSLISYFYPERATTIKLNSILIPALEDYAREYGVNELYVSPIGKQGRILEKWYGFVECAPIPKFPCDIILGSPESGSSPAGFYVKYL